MPKGPQGQKRPADTVANAIRVAKILTGEVEEDMGDSGKDKALMLKQGSGTIVNTSSGAGVKGIAGQAAYCAAKFGVIGLTKAAALDYAAQNIIVGSRASALGATVIAPRASAIGKRAADFLMLFLPFSHRNG
jgi:NAD(P)-dependent dehydrogenase (short-subunit alcohol dehydrogenase family)